MTFDEFLALAYKSVYTGQQIDNALARIISGEIDSKVISAENSAQNALEYANIASQKAAAAATSAASAATSADNAASSATTASQKATAAAMFADNAASSAATAAQRITAAATSVTNAAATSASNAASSATTASQKAAAAAISAINAETSANNAASSAKTAVQRADVAAISASDAATSATNAATSANNAATSATNAANSAAAAESFSKKPPKPVDGTWWTYDADRDVYTDTGLKSVLSIVKSYPSIAAMNADFRNMEVGDLVIINSSDTDIDNSKLFVHDGGASWKYLSDLSGLQGVGIADIRKTGGDGTPGSANIYTITLTDERTFFFETLNGPRGPQGINGVAVASNGIFAFNVDSATGHLLLDYTGNEAPVATINNAGHLIMTI